MGSYPFRETESSPRTHRNIGLFSAAGLAVVLQGSRHTMHRTPFIAFGLILLLLPLPGV
jgi:hypothetical protein